MIKSHHFSAILSASPAVLNWDKKDFIDVLKNAAHTAKLTVVGELGVEFVPQGISTIVLLAESHIALHFWTETAKVTIDIHICDYQTDNLEKAIFLTKILSQEISNDDKLGNWHYLSISN
ncbi:MAG: S-adenosylmethionine decarboxylase [Cuspidothrix sp.]|uniref:S-adenosylmethionine decarboxylase n=1 Tax=Cuspidothrix issatschenkoi CHARLIE-1 TaxID=2052836 RepID=A0A2S6CZ44_9CYAN|nr:S-adenosylmethionine decarboxylase [Cuspidothrix issatschenkoi]PPJ64961.1 S-adenosylmethionine decarboxylase [Cuspidothrix issatschenkoi CHARLIE-1]